MASQVSEVEVCGLKRELELLRNENSRLMLAKGKLVKENDSQIHKESLCFDESIFVPSFNEHSMATTKKYFSTM